PGARVEPVAAVDRADRGSSDRGGADRPRSPHALGPLGVGDPRLRARAEPAGARSAPRARLEQPVTAGEQSPDTRAFGAGAARTPAPPETRARTPARPAAGFRRSPPAA